MGARVDDMRASRAAGRPCRRSPSSRRPRSRRRATERWSTSTSPACSPGRTRPSSRSSRRRAASRPSRTSRAAHRRHPDEAVEEVEEFEAVGVEHLVFDFRFKFDRWFERSSCSAARCCHACDDPCDEHRSRRGDGVHRARPRAAGRHLPRTGEDVFGPCGHEQPVADAVSAWYARHRPAVVPAADRGRPLERRVAPARQRWGQEPRSSTLIWTPRSVVPTTPT